MERSKIVLSGGAGALLSLLVGLFVLKSGQAMDFAVFWAAHQVGNPYDMDALRPVIGQVVPLPKHGWPYPYPPTFLLLTSWFRLLPFEPAYLLWLMLSGGLLTASARHPFAPLLLFSPWVIYALMAGQTSLIMGGLILSALFFLERPRLAGLLLGMAACIKPQFVVLVFVGLLFAQHWRVLLWAIGIGTVIVLASVIAYGVGAWIEWLQFLPEMYVGTTTISQHLDVADAWKIPVLAVGLVLIWHTFRNGSAPEKAVAAAGVSLLCLPHSLWYNAALMATAILATKRWLPLPALAFWPSTLLVALGTIGSLLRVPATHSIGRNKLPPMRHQPARHQM